MKKSLVIGLITGIIGTMLLATATWLTIVYTGAYNVATTKPHLDPVRWSFDTTLRRSVAERAEDVVLPEDIPQDLIAQGAGITQKAAPIAMELRVRNRPRGRREFGRSRHTWSRRRRSERRRRFTGS